MSERVFPDWHEVYREQAVETMPWFTGDLDPDFAQDLANIGLSGGRLLDVGTGPGTQAIALARRGFEVTATDLSSAAIAGATERAAAAGVRVDFRVDDVLDSKIVGEFDAVLDRGCFHTLPPARRSDYVRNVAERIRSGGHLLLKCFSHLQPGDVGPYQFTGTEIGERFAPAFTMSTVRHTIYHGTHEPPPKALACVLLRV